MSDTHQVVNLTGHDIVVDTAPVGARGEQAKWSSPSTIPPAGGTARVREPIVSATQLPTEYGAVREITLRRSQNVEDLPPARSGIVYIVPRLTAAAARDREDLRFPYDEHRRDGVVIGVRALGRFIPERSLLRRVAPSTFHGWLRRQTHDVQRITVAIAVLFSVTTALIGGVLGFLPDMATENPGSADLWIWLTWSAVLAVAALITLTAGVRLWRRRSRILAQRGTAYIVEELAESWTYEEKRTFLAALEQEFAAVLRVPGPADLGDDWRWPLGDGAERWSEKVDDLVRAFWAVHYNDDQVTDNAVFIWAWWPVALAFAARTTSGRRGLTLRIRRRPSSGREGRLQPEGWREDPVSFVWDPAPRKPKSNEVRWRARATVTPQSDLQPNTQASSEPVSLLLVRMTRGAWGPLPPAGQTPQQPAHLEIIDWAGTGLVGTVDIDIFEWRCLAEPEPFHALEDYPALAQAAADWVMREASSRQGVVLLGMLVMQEVAAGIGVLASAQHVWPDRLWPVLHDQIDGVARLVIPRLDLGRSSLRHVGG